LAGLSISAHAIATLPEQTHYPVHVDEIGLFPLPVVLVPGEQAPLHIFEPRYRELIGESLERAELFGLVFADDEGIREVGTLAAVVEVLERFDDGRLNVVVEGRERFRVVEVTEGLRPFATAEVREIEDDGEAPTDDERAAMLDAYDRVVAAAEAELDDLDRDGNDLSFQVLARIDLGAEVKQRLLETRSERERVVSLAALLEHAAEAVAREREIQKRASGNGRVEAL
jgi:Lon protease-like protein